MRATDLDDLLKVVESVRAEHEPSLPADLVRGIVFLEEQHGEDEDAALRALREHVEQFVSGENS